ncbi:hypothetical protein [Aliiroseovarius lamellibrachiae]|uniref:hypothetical protein n=1 Tax=Aliiroseovarius lamellibrachiae TaxID=1924933 RepID=UPI001BE015B9|nr:hypothetical protein [Aliiroseovarius lamellibrachiae]MBT2130195.1 hypothetical protein [Aliiroseovarius lamellibrachiae]
MSEMTLTKARIQAGVWEGVLALGAHTDLPQLELTHLAKPIAGMSVEEDPDHRGQYLVRVPIPVELLSDGVQTFVISAVESGEKLTHFSVITGQPVGDDIIAEMDLLRAELDMLKRAFRKHCLETM